MRDVGIQPPRWSLLPSEGSQPCQENRYIRAALLLCFSTASAGRTCPDINIAWLETKVPWALDRPILRQLYRVGPRVQLDIRVTVLNFLSGQVSTHTTGLRPAAPGTLLLTARGECVIGCVSFNSSGIGHCQSSPWKNFQLQQAALYYQCPRSIWVFRHLLRRGNALTS